jgi:hypothetical protein
MHELYELKEMLCKELEEYGRKGDLSAGSLEIVDKLAHALKNLDKIIESKEEESGEEYSGAMYRRGGSYRYDDGMMTGGSYRGGSYARGDGRGRGSNARRDSMGRYSSRGYSRAEGDMDEIVEELRGMMGELPEDKQREVQRFIEKVERM